MLLGAERGGYYMIFALLAQNYCIANSHPFSMDGYHTCIIMKFIFVKVPVTFLTLHRLLLYPPFAVCSIIPLATTVSSWLIKTSIFDAVIYSCDSGVSKVELYPFELAMEENLTRVFNQLFQYYSPRSTLFNPLNHCFR